MGGGRILMGRRGFSCLQAKVAPATPMEGEGGKLLARKSLAQGSLADSSVGNNNTGFNSNFQNQGFNNQNQGFNNQNQGFNNQNQNNRGCQCDYSLTFSDQNGNTHGACQRRDNTGRTWCYTTGWNNNCGDLQSSKRYQNNPWSYRACSNQG